MRLNNYDLTRSCGTWYAVLRSVSPVYVQFARWRHRRQSLPSPTASTELFGFKRTHHIKHL